MKIFNLLLLLFLFLFPVTSFSQSTIHTKPFVRKGLQKNKLIDVAGKNRTYHLFVPNNPINAPLVILLHGNRGSHNKMLGLKRGKTPYKIWLELAKRENILLAVPNGLRGSNHHRGWNDCRSDVETNPQSDDVLFLSSLIDHIAVVYGANIEKVYVMGTSNGGHMSIRMAQEVPQKLTAFAAVVAANPVNSKCVNSDLPVSALFMNGTADPILPFSGGQMASSRGEVFSSENSVSSWVERNKTNGTPTITNIPNINSSDKSSIEKFEYANGANNTEVVFYKVNNGGHTEPSKKERYRRFYLSLVGNQNADIEMAEEVWRFFKNKSK